MKKCGKCHQRGHNRRTCGVKKPSQLKRVPHVNVSGSSGVQGSDVNDDSGVDYAGYDNVLDSLIVEIGKYEKTKSENLTGGDMETTETSSVKTSEQMWTVDELNTLWLLQGKDEKMTSKDDPRWERWYTSNGERFHTGKSETATNELVHFLNTYKDYNLNRNDWKVFLSQFPPEVREQLAKRSGLTNPIYVALAQDRSSLVRGKALANRNLDASIVGAIVEDMTRKKRTMSTLATIDYVTRKREDLNADTLQRIYGYVVGEAGSTQQSTFTGGGTGEGWTLVPNDWLVRTKFRSKETYRTKSRENRLKKLITTQILVSEKTPVSLFKTIVKEGLPLEFLSATFSILKSERVDNSQEKFNFLASWVKKKIAEGGKVSQRDMGYENLRSFVQLKAGSIWLT